MDILGPLPVTERGNRYILVVGDYFTRWKEAFLMKDMEAQTVACILVNEFICRMGVPDTIHTDQGRNFESNLIKELPDAGNKEDKNHPIPSPVRRDG